MYKKNEYTFVHELVGINVQELLDFKSNNITG